MFANGTGRIATSVFLTFSSSCSLGHFENVGMTRVHCASPKSAWWLRQWVGFVCGSQTCISGPRCYQSKCASYKRSSTRLPSCSRTSSANYPTNTTTAAHTDIRKRLPDVHFLKSWGQLKGATPRKHPVHCKNCNIT